MQNISVSLKIVKRGQEAARLRTSFGPQVEAAVMKARARLLALQRPEGYWWEELEANSTLTSEYVFLMHMLDRVDEGRQAKCAAELLAEQLPDGGWGIGDGKGGQLSASIEAYAALKLVGCDLDSAPMARARQFILARGGLGQARMFTRIHFALLGWWSYDALPALPPWIMMLPERSPISIYQMSSWARSCVVPLIILLDKKPVWRPRRNIDLAELIVRRDGTCTDTQDAASANGPGASSRNALFGVIDRVLRWLDRHDFVPLRRRSIRRAESWILERQDDEGDWGGILPAMMYSLLALRALGYAVDHPVLRRGRAAIDRFAIESGTRLRMQSCVSPVWDSALAIWSLREAGLPADHPALAGGAHWLLGKQVSRYGDWSVKNRGGKPGGWSFEFYNRYYPDCDDTAAVILALHGLDLGPDNAYRDASIENAREWVLSMQCRNGGWAAFDVDNTQQLWNRIPFADHGAMLDEASPDVTGHVLEILYAGAGDGARAAA
ncbi:MAG TPA: squalene--hopene cyclase, partial [Noviherbaspirillum sp.]